MYVFYFKFLRLCLVVEDKKTKAIVLYAKINCSAIVPVDTTHVKHTLTEKDKSTTAFGGGLVCVCVCVCVCVNVCVCVCVTSVCVSVSVCVWGGGGGGAASVCVCLNSREA